MYIYLTIHKLIVFKITFYDVNLFVNNEKKTKKLNDSCEDKKYLEAAMLAVKYEML